MGCSIGPIGEDCDETHMSGPVKRGRRTTYSYSGFPGEFGQLCRNFGDKKTYRVSFLSNFFLGLYGGVIDSRFLCTVARLMIFTVWFLVVLTF